MIQYVSKADWLLHGIFGLSKALFGFDKAPQEIVRQRKKICERCMFNKKLCCQRCGCFIPAKIRVYSEICPIYLWY